MPNDIIPAGINQDPVSALLTRAATDPNFDAQKFEVAVRFITEREAKQAHRAFNDAMARTQEELRAVTRGATNDHLRSRYAKLDPMLAVILPTASKNGLSIRFGSAPASQPGWQCVTCIVSLGDHVETTALEGPIVTTGSQGGKTQMTPIQATGSTTTYLKRYLLGMVFSLVLSDEQDDDGEAARKPIGAKATPASHPPYQKPAGHAPEAPQADPDPLMEQNGTRWLKNLDALLGRATTEAEVVEIGGHPRVRASLETAPTLIVDRINTMLREAQARVAPKVEEDAVPEWPDPIADLRVEIEAMDLATIDDLRNSSAWKEKTKHLIPPDWELLEEAIAARRVTLQGDNKHE